ncbi:ABC transporter substrate-binding protein [Streptomyces sp. MB09-01]|uniref:ABC transporter substrate-binding protein n=1 Tax=Streptomyces sp. MB09-01 TaxID=3028666 RepID=UPI0029B356B6|nr:ABC transporter substrate-binding protein [Streptomyces sp. MB09-01]MDX3532928.1 ABC transporter substrate-binding protein [Streptomyces sp. MB09-01]
MRRPGKTTRRSAATATAALALALGTTACGGTTGPASGGELSGQTVTVAGVWTGAEQQNFKKVLDAFTEKTGARTVFVPSGDNVSTFVGSKIEGGNAPDVVMVPQVGVLQQFAKEGWLQPLSDQTAQTAGSTLAPVWKDYGTVGGTYYGLYFKAAHKSTVWYAPEAFAQAGVGEPKSYSDMLKTGRTLADSGRPAFAIAGEDGWTLTDWFENIYLSQAGPEKYDQLAQHKLKWTDESVVRALTTLGELFKDKQLVAGGAQAALGTDFPSSVAQVFGPEPKAGMVYEGDFVGGVAKGQFGKKLGQDAKFFPFPSVDGGRAPVVSGGDAAVVLKDGKNAGAGMKLVEFLASSEAAEVWAGAGGFLSPNNEVDFAKYSDDTTRSTANSLIAAGNSIRFDMSDQAPAAFGGTKGAGEWKLLQDFLRDPSDPQATAAKLEAEAAKAYGN